MSAKHGLGRGLGALLKDQPESAPSPRAEGGILRVAVDLIKRNPFQPRRVFDDDALAELTASVRDRGILQPLLVRGSKKGYELIAGERRLRAATLAGIREVPIVVLEAEDHDSLELALIENLQREDLNVIEEAEGYRALADRFKMTQDEVAQRVGKARASVTNAIRLLQLPQEVRQMIVTGHLSAGHAKILAGLEDSDVCLGIARRIVSEGLSVRALERHMQVATAVPKKPRVAKPDMPASHIKDLCDKLHEHFATSVRLSPCKTLANGKKAKGTVEIDFFSNEDLGRILERLGLRGD